MASCPKIRTEPKSRILEAFSRFAGTSRRGTGSIGTLYVGVRDDGLGLKREVADRTFGPFYTTKKLGKGLGLASSSREIAKICSPGMRIERLRRDSAFFLFPDAYGLTVANGHRPPTSTRSNRHERLEEAVTIVFVVWASRSTFGTNVVPNAWTTRTECLECRRIVREESFFWEALEDPLIVKRG